MVDYSYTVVPGKLGPLLDKVREIGVPKKLDHSWLKSIGFKSSNDRSLLTVLKHIGFITTTGAPSERWTQYRGAHYKSVLAEGIRWGYKDLFDTYPAAEKKSATDLSHFFSTKTSAGKQVIDKTVSTFKALCALADFSLKPKASEENAVVEEANLDTGDGDSGKIPPGAPGKKISGSGIIVNLNIQFTLPEAKDPATYDHIFAALRKNVLKYAK